MQKMKRAPLTQDLENMGRLSSFLVHFQTGYFLGIFSHPFSGDTNCLFILSIESMARCECFGSNPDRGSSTKGKTAFTSGSFRRSSASLVKNIFSHEILETS